MAAATEQQIVAAALALKGQDDALESERAVWQTREIAAQQAARERWAAAEAEREAASRRALGDLVDALTAGDVAPELLERAEVLLGRRVRE